MSKKLIILDFDGVIVDTYDLSMNILSKLFSSASKKAFDASLSGTYSTSWFRRTLRWMYSRYFLLMYAFLLKPSMLFPAVPQMIKDLDKQGLIVVFTSGLKEPVERFLTATELLASISEVKATGGVASKKSGLQMLMQKYGCSPYNGPIN